MWKEVAGYEGLYEVSDEGRVRSIDRVVVYPKGGKRVFFGKERKPVSDRVGYLQVQLYVEGTHKTFSIHRLVATAFVDNPYGKPHVNHIDGNKHNNSAGNLEWVTISENLLHAVRLGLVKGKTLSENEVNEARRLYANGETQKRIGILLGVSETTAHNAIHGKRRYS
jgi:hypothetical protein